MNTGLSPYCVRFVAESSQVTNAAKVKTGFCVSVCVCVCVRVCVWRVGVYEVKDCKYTIYHFICTWRDREG